MANEKGVNDTASGDYDLNFSKRKETQRREGTWLKTAIVQLGNDSFGLDPNRQWKWWQKNGQHFTQKWKENQREKRLEAKKRTES